MTLVVRARDLASVSERTVRAAMREVDPNALVSRVDAIPDQMSRSFAQERYRAWLISLFSAIAMLLAGAGMYGVVSRAVGNRRREIGIRMALGAAPGGVMRLVIASTLAGTALGVLSGGAIS